MNETTPKSQPSLPEEPARLLDQAGDVDLSSITGSEDDPQAAERAEALRRLRTLGYL